MRRRTVASAVALALLLTISTAVSAGARSSVAATKFPSLLVRVVDAQTNLPIPGAEVVVSFLEGDPDHPIVTGVAYNASTNGGGHVFYDGLQGGVYVVSVRAGGYYFFGHGAQGHQLPTGERVILVSRFGGGAAGNTPTHVIIRLVPICDHC